MTDTADHKIKVYGPSAEYRFFLYCPNDGHTFYRTREERGTAAQQLIREYLDCGEWSEQVVDIYAGEVTHQVNEVERLERVGQLDDDGYDENGEYWEDSDIECKCNYALQPLAQPAPAEPVELVELTDLELLRTYAAAQRNYRFEGPTYDWPRDEARALTVAGLRAVIAADRARRPAPSAEGVVGELVAWIYQQAIHGPDGDEWRRAADLLQQQAAELAMLRQRVAPVPVSERPWKNEAGWLDPDGECWWCPPDGPAYWSMANPAMVYGGWLLPAHAIPVPPENRHHD